MEIYVAAITSIDQHLESLCNKFYSATTSSSTGSYNHKNRGICGRPSVRAEH